ncbi:MAG TPA: LLM class flavin-dependent oxidoreductase [Chloroflexota bacterium]|nr:LLM class flavin-dependent oxidoreductase [Chloroflexota bacterium]
MPIHPALRRPIEFLGFVQASPFTEVEDWAGPAVQPDYVRDLARAHEDAGFDRVLIGYYSAAADGWQLSAYVTQQTERLGVLIAHRPGFVQPTLAARFASTLDHFSHGRVALHIVTGGSEADQVSDGDVLPKEQRYERTSEYIDVLRKCWADPNPFDYHGNYYHVEGVNQQVRPYQEHGIPIFFGGSSSIALDIAAQKADLYACFGEPVAEIRERIADMRSRAASYGRELGYSVSLRPILGATEDEAWDRAHDFLERIRERKRRNGSAHKTMRAGATAPEGARRLLAAADRGEIHDKRLWFEIARETGAAGNSTAPVGTAEQVAETILGYVDAGATSILIRGFEPIKDAAWYGRELIPLVRKQLA